VKTAARRPRRQQARALSTGYPQRTCNYILTRNGQTGEGCHSRTGLKDAAAAWLCPTKPDPTFDIEGHDTAQKLSILASLAFGTKVDPASIYVEGISSIAPADLAAADQLGYRVKLLGVRG
jgi:homoserine dehydrogenase